MSLIPNRKSLVSATVAALLMSVTAQAANTYAKTNINGTKRNIDLPQIIQDAEDGALKSCFVVPNIADNDGNVFNQLYLNGTFAGNFDIYSSFDTQKLADQLNAYLADGTCANRSQDELNMIYDSNLLNAFTDQSASNCYTILGVDGWANQLYINGQFSGNYKDSELKKLQMTLVDNIVNGTCTYSGYSTQPVPAPAPAPAEYSDIVKITAINSNYDTNHSQEILVYPGQMITLSADLLDPNNFNAAVGDEAEDFAWSDGATTCAANAQGCFDDSNGRFQRNDFGVSYYVPADMGAEVQLTVQSYKNGYISQDRIVLRNQLAQTYQDYTAPVYMVSSAEEYRSRYPDHDEFRPEYALAGHGRWITIDGVAYFSPSAYTLYEGETEWVPYRHGYWSWDSNQGWTWISHDNWGWYTDHYGAWRHNDIYGWLWIAFTDRQYQPHTVTWFHDTDGSIGWYPYFHNEHFEKYSYVYAHGAEHGFSDGYWDGYNSSRYHSGYTRIHGEDFAHADIAHAYYGYPEQRNGSWDRRSQEIMMDRRVLVSNPGGTRGEASRTFVVNHTHVNVTNIYVTNTTIVHVNNRTVYVVENPVEKKGLMPAQYQHMSQKDVRVAEVKQGSIGSVTQVSANGKKTVIATTSNGRAMVAAPVAKDAQGNRVVIAVKTTTRSQANANSPIAATATKAVTLQVKQSQAANKAPIEKFDPKKAADAKPVVNRSNPNAQPPKVIISKPLPPAPAPTHKPTPSLPTTTGTGTGTGHTTTPTHPTSHPTTGGTTGAGTGGTTTPTHPTSHPTTGGTTGSGTGGTTTPTNPTSHPTKPDSKPSTKPAVEPKKEPAVIVTPPTPKKEIPVAIPAAPKKEVEVAIPAAKKEEAPAAAKPAIPVKPTKPKPTH